MKELILIPSYKPDGRLLEFLDELKSEGFSDVLIVDDGSGSEFAPVYDKVTKQYPHCEIIYHAVNQGKGRALKTGFNHALNKHDDLLGVVACDADGQHPASSVKEAAKAMDEHPDKLILGTRRFLKGKNVPTGNLIGNLITIAIFKLLTGLSFGDTQCGLRAFPKDVMKQLINTSGERFEYENVMLLDVRTKRIGYVEFPMDAIYLEGEDYTTHFNKLKDSFLIYVNILKFALLPVFSGAVAYYFSRLMLMIAPLCSLYKMALIYGAGILIGWLIMMIPVSDEKNNWWSALYSIVHTAVFTFLFYWLFVYKAVGYNSAWWICAIFAAPTAYAGYLRMRFGKKPKRVKI